MSEQDLKDLLTQALPIVDEAAQFIRGQYGKVGAEAIEEKSRNSLVSYVDKQAEEVLVQKLGTILPGATFLTEEDTVLNDRSELVWIIDPLDGTTNFLQQIPFFSVSVALEYEGNMVLGIVQSILQGETFYATKGGGAFCNDTKINVGRPQGLEQTILATGFPYAHRTDAYLRTLQDFLGKVQGLRRLGSAALDMAYVAAGRFGAYYEFNLNIWDVAAGAVIVREAGGVVKGFYDDQGWKDGKYVLASAPSILSEVQHVLQHHRP